MLKDKNPRYAKIMIPMLPLRFPDACKSCRPMGSTQRVEKIWAEARSALKLVTAPSGDQAAQGAFGTCNGFLHEFLCDLREHFNNTLRRTAIRK